MSEWILGLYALITAGALWGIGIAIVLILKHFGYEYDYSALICSPPFRAKKEAIRERDTLNDRAGSYDYEIFKHNEKWFLICGG